MGKKDTKLLLDDNKNGEIIEGNRDDLIAYQYFIRGIQQHEIADKFGLSQQYISKIVNRYRDDDILKQRVVSIQERDFSLHARRKAQQIVASINVDRMSDNSKAMSASILIDKARLLDGQPSHISDIRVTVKEIEDNDAELRQMYHELGRDYIDVTPEPIDTQSNSINDNEDD